jgi:hypothetical protein
MREARRVCCLAPGIPPAEPVDRRCGCKDVLTESDAGGSNESDGATGRLESLLS